MGTNFYWKKTGRHILDLDVSFPFVNEKDDPLLHIGKRSAAGYYCWGCRKTLCKDGEALIHFTNAIMAERPVEWLDYCPCCGLSKVIEPLESGAAGIELGFSKPKTNKQTGISSVSSFTWAQKPFFVKSVCKKYTRSILIEDEYGQGYSGKQFFDMLEYKLSFLR